MKSEFEHISGVPIIPESRSDFSKNTDSQSCSVMIIDHDESVHQLVEKALKYFSFNGKNINILSTSNLKTASAYLFKNHEIILVVLNRNSFDDGELQQFIYSVGNGLINTARQIIFKDELIASRHLLKNPNLNGLEGTSLELEELRGNMINYLRQVFISYGKEEERGLRGKSVSVFEESTKDKGVDGKINKKSNLSREKIYSVLAHDLKGPISSIKVLMDVLTSEPELLDKDTTRDLLLNVRDTTSSIHEMLENFMFWVRVHKQHVNFSPMKISLNDIVNQNISLLKSTAFNKKIKLQSGIGANVLIFADEYMLNTILRNLMYNALKFTKASGEVQILVNERAMDVEIIIRDNGVGISKNDLADIVNDKIHFSKKGTNKEKGTGFGLLISKEFIEKNGGHLIITSEENIGSSFSFTVPKWKSMIAN